MLTSAATSVDSELLGLGGGGFASSGDNERSEDQSFDSFSPTDDINLKQQLEADKALAARNAQTATASPGDRSSVSQKSTTTAEQAVNAAVTAGASWALQDVVTGQLAALVLTTFFEPLTTLLNLAALSFEWGFVAITGRAELPMWQKFAIAVGDILIPLLYFVVVMALFASVDCLLDFKIISLILGGSPLGLCPV